MQIAELNKIFLERLKSIYSPNEINSVFAILTEHLLNYSKKDLLLKKGEIIKDENASKFFILLEELEKNKPIQYIIGETEFYGLKLKVNNNVLIPRPETEELVDWIIKDVKSENNFSEKTKILDIGTGSGCISIALKKNLPDAVVFAMDVSENALKIAKENAIINNTDINFFQADILNSQFQILNSQFLIIVSNPPYITVQEKEKMQKNVLDHEPDIALFTPVENPLLFYDAIVNFAKKHLYKNGFIYFEINEIFGEQIKNLLAGNGFYDIILKKDLSGKDRMIRATK